jgi:hypothetical protein
MTVGWAGRREEREMSLVRNRSNKSWMRALAIGACATLGLSAFAGGTAGASTTPPMGSVTCGATGSAAVRPAGIPGTTQPPAVNWTIAKIHKAALDSCNSAGVTGGKATINGGVITINARLNPGASCDTLMASLTSVAKAVVIVKFTSTTVDPITLMPITRTVAVVRPQALQIVASGAGVHVTGTLPQTLALSKPFGGEVFESQLNIDNTADVAACQTTPTPLTHLDFSTAGGSSISIHP